MAKICMLLTKTPWDDMRQFHWQAPALVDGGHEVIYMSGKPDRQVSVPFKFSLLTEKQRKFARLGAINLFRKILQENPDVVQLCSVEQLPLGLALKTFTKIKVIYDCREDMYFTIRDHKEHILMPFRHLLAGLVRFIEYISDCVLDGIVTSDPAIYDAHRAMPQLRKIIFYNTPLLSLFPPPCKPYEKRKYDVVLMGSMSSRTGVTALLDAVGILKNRGYLIKVLLLGQPIASLTKNMETLIEKYGLRDQIVITGRVPHESVPDILSDAKIGLVGLLDMPKFRRNIACKSFEYMACCMPVVSSDLPPERLFIKEGKTGLFFKAGDSAEMAQRISFLLDNLPVAEQMGQNGRAVIEKRWNCERMQKELQVFYDRILKIKRRGWFV